MKIKNGVVMAGLQIEMRKALKVADEIYRRHNRELVITSALDGTHSAGSLHYYGYAIDMRTWYFKKAIAREVALLLRKALGNKYYVLLESNHIHIQYNAHNISG